jgi:hypothetical protein
MLVCDMERHWHDRLYAAHTTTLPTTTPQAIAAIAVANRDPKKARPPPGNCSRQSDPVDLQVGDRSSEFHPCLRASGMAIGFCRSGTGGVQGYGDRFNGIRLGCVHGDTGLLVRRRHLVR